MVNFVLSPVFALAFLAALAHSAPMGDQVWSNTLDDGSTGDDYERLVDSQIRENPVMMYTGSRCGMSRASKDLLNSKYPGLRYKYLDYDVAPGGDWIMGPVIRLSHSAKLPQIFICGRYIGGKSALYAYHESGQLKGMIRQCTSF